MEVFWWNGRWKKGEEIEVYSGTMDGKMDSGLESDKPAAVAEECRYGLMGWRVKMMGG